MIRPILFRGGMFGDLMLGMLDPSALQKKTIYQKHYRRNSVAGYFIKYTRTQQKKFSNYPQIKKEIYYQRFMKVKRPVYIVTHDTDFSKHYQDQTVQLICSDESLITRFAERFYTLHSDKVSAEARSHLGSNTGNFVKDYADDIIRWQNFHKFKHRFDIKNIYNKKTFLDDFDRFFVDADSGWSHKIYSDHLQSNKIW